MSREEARKTKLEQELKKLKSQLSKVKYDTDVVTSTLDKPGMTGQMIGMLQNHKKTLAKQQQNLENKINRHQDLLTALQVVHTFTETEQAMVDEINSQYDTKYQHSLEQLKKGSQEKKDCFFNCYQEADSDDLKKIVLKSTFGH